MTVYCGRVHKFGDDINTDYIISSRRKRDTLDLNILKKYIMEDISNGFGDRVNENDIIAAGENFGCGSAMEVASLVLKAAGISVILAKSFARTFYRNGINGGLLLIECNTEKIVDGSIIKIQIIEDRILILDTNNELIHKLEPLSGITTEIVKSGGLIKYIKENGDFVI